MSKKVRITLITIGSIIGLLLLALIIGNIVVKNKLEKFFTNGLPEHIAASYGNLDVHLITGTMTFSDISVSLQDTSKKAKHTHVKTEKLIVEDFKYWDYLFNNQIHLEAIQISKPDITYYKHKYQPNQNTTNSSTATNKPLQRTVLIDKFSIDNAKITMYDDTTDSTFLYVPDIMVTVSGLYFDNETLQKRLPVTYKNYQASTDSIFLKVGAYEALKTGPLQLKNKKLKVDLTPT